ncbi:hypothetical protein HWV62_16284 [Athelia sp. TMB]|nr:hypothetical protein HWV62_16284 [Athelia sp. TMB]
MGELQTEAITTEKELSTASESLTVHRMWQYWLKRARRFISDFEPGRSSMRLTEKRRNGGFVESNKGLLFVLCVFVAFMQAGLFTAHAAQKSREVYPDAIGPTTPQGPTKGFAMDHPIPRLMADAENKFRALLGKQSRTLSAAVKEYKRRYGRKPPRGFDEWWKFAKENNVKMIDEYDGLVEDLAPFWEMSGEELRRRAWQIASFDSIDLVRVQDGNTTIENLSEGTDPGARAKGFRDMLFKFKSKLPDMDFPVNTKSEGRILVPWELRKYPNITEQEGSQGFDPKTFSADWQGEGNVWEAYRRACPPDSPARHMFASMRATIPASPVSKGNFFAPQKQIISGGEFSFAPHTSGHFDFCQNPWARYTQGHFFSDWRTIPMLYPVFSPAKGKGYSDIRIPSHYYYGSVPRYTYGWDPVNMDMKAVDGNELPWEKKSDKIFWRGATTGGGSTPAGFTHQYHRHRFLRMATDTSDTNRTITFADPPSSTNFVSEKVPARAVNQEIMDVAFVKAVGYYPAGDAALARDHRFDDAVSLGKHWAYKYLLDLDGMSYSGRFMGFLASDSVPMKATIYQEYFSDWIQPCNAADGVAIRLHYIPLSASYKEIYNIHAYFSGAPAAALEASGSSSSRHAGSAEGDRRLRRIARAGKQWKQTIGRTVDMEAYVYRMCLEYARLWADDRAAMDFVF